MSPYPFTTTLASRSNLCHSVAPERMSAIVDLQIGDKVFYRDTGGNTSGVHDGESGTIVDFECGAPVVQWHGEYRKNRAPLVWMASSLIPAKWVEQLKAGSET